MRATRVLFVIPSLQGGGAERVVVTLLKNLDRQRVAPSLAVFARTGPYSADLPQDIIVHDLRRQKRTGYPRALMRLVRLIRTDPPDVLFSLMWHANILTLVARVLSRTNAKLVLGVRNQTSLLNQFANFTFLRNATVRTLYPRADVLLANSVGALEDLAGNFSLRRDKLRVIYNPIDVKRIRDLTTEPISQPWLDPDRQLVLAVGRLAKQKGFEYLIRAFAEVRKHLPCTLAILGDGPERGDLQNVARSLGLGSDFILPGFQKNPYKFMKKAAAFVLSSLWEGFPNVILEAMACGVPVVATRCPSGPEEIIEHADSGLLAEVSNEADLAEKILAVLRDRDLSAKLRAGALARAEDFDVGKIVPQFEQLFLEAAQL
jgi:glycosyltransferase involved in cell wall biosynthesis